MQQQPSASSARVLHPSEYRYITPKKTREGSLQPPNAPKKERNDAARVVYDLGIPPFPPLSTPQRATPPPAPSLKPSVSPADLHMKEFELPESKFDVRSQI